MALKSYTTVEEKFKPKVKIVWGLVPTFIEVTGQKLVGRKRLFASPIKNRVNNVSIACSNKLPTPNKVPSSKK